MADAKKANEQTKKTKAQIRPRHQYSERLDTSTKFPSATRAKQSAKDECDINNILTRFAQTGQLTHVNNRQPTYGDAPNLDFREALEVVLRAEQDFLRLPSALRRRFNDDPEQFLEFTSDPDNLAEMGDLGLLNDQAMEALKTEQAASEAALDAPAAPPVEQDDDT